MSGKARRMANRLLLIGVLLAVLLSGCDKPDTYLNTVELSYFENPSWCDGCPKFRLNFYGGGTVDLYCLRGCAVPGHYQIRIAPYKFAELVDAFNEVGFFSMARAGRMAFDTTIITLAYRDSIRVHETVDWMRERSSLVRLETKVRAAVDLESYFKPAIPFYEQLLRQGWDVNTMGEDHENALLKAILQDHGDAVLFLIAHGARVSDASRTHLVWAHDSRIAPAVLNAGSFDIHSSLGRYVVRLSVRNLSFLRLLLERGAEVNVADPSNDHDTPLLAAVKSGELGTTDLLLGHGADLKPQDRYRRDALSYAADSLNSGFISMLHDHGANVNAADGMGMTPLTRAAEQCYYWNIEALLKAGADARAVAIRDAFHRTPRIDEKCRKSMELLDAAVRTNATR